MLGDGDAEAFDAVEELAPYPGVTIMHECMNQVHKRLGTVLLITHHTDDADGMRDAVWAKLFYCMSTD